MTKFSPVNFENDELRMKLVVILNDKLMKPILTKYSSLTQREQREYNKELNAYIYNLPEDYYIEKITKDFNEIVYDYLTDVKTRFEELPIQNINSISVELTKEDDLDTKLNELEQKHSQVLLDERC